MSTFETTQPQTIWWHTVLHILASFLLVIPMVVIVSVLYGSGFSYYVGDAAKAGFITHGAECAIGSFLTIGLPYKFLRRSHILVTATIFSTVWVIFFCLVILFQFKLGFAGVGFFDIIDLITSGAGLIAGAIFAVASSDEFLGGLRSK